MRGRKYDRAGAAVYRSRRWKALRFEVLRRFSFECSNCGSRVNLEVDHIRGIREHPEGAYEIGNLQVLCRRCHSAKTRTEIHGPLSPEREAWRTFLNALA